MAGDRYEAKLDDFSLEIETVEDSIEKSIAKYEFPYRDGALLEDMGQRARVVRFRCYWYEETYESHKDFLKHLEKKELFELLHPKYGLIKGSIESVSVRHDDRSRTAEAEISFVEGLITGAESAGYINKGAVEWIGENTFAAGQYELMEELEIDVREILGPEAMDILTAAIDPEQSLVDQFTGISVAARDYVKAADTFVGGLAGTLSSISNPADSLLALVNFPGNLAGAAIGTLARVLERYSVLYGTLKTSPARYLKSLNGSFMTLAGTWRETSFGKYITIASAQRRALETAYIFREDESNRQRVKRMEAVKGFDALGNRTALALPDKLMTIDEIELILGSVREDIQTAVTLSRSMRSLKGTAASLLAHVNDIKLEREKIVTIETDNTLPLHLLCLKYGLPYNYATRINSINRIKHPSFTPPGKVRIYVR